MATDPYQVLGVTPSASDEELRAAHRRLVKLHHPDHNAGSVEAARRFEEVQEAYARVLEQRRAGAARDAAGRGGAGAAGAGAARSAPSDVDERLADLERQVREANAARERARRAAREAAAAAAPDARRATDEELGYVTTDDSLSKIVADALDALAAKLKRD